MSTARTEALVGCTGDVGCKQKKEENQEFGRQKDVERRVSVVVKNITPRGSLTETEIKRNERNGETKEKEAQSTETEYQQSTAIQYVTQI